MKTIFYSLLLLVLPGWVQARDAGEPAARGVTYVIPVKDMIERALVHLIRRGVDEAKRDGAQTIVLDMDTPGGRLDATEEILDLMADTGATTYTLVNPNAISAGAIIAFGTDRIYMTPGGRIGDAMPLMMSPLPFGAPQEIPDGIKEKMVSPTVAMIRSAAQRKGHDERLAEAMVRMEIEYKIGDTVICPAGQLLTLTSQDAAQLVGEGDERRPLLSKGTVKDLDDLLKTIGREKDRIVFVEATAAERVARFIEGFPVSGLLLGLGLLLLYIEFKTPGFGLPGLSGIALLAVWFWGHHVAGLANVLEIVVFLVGFLLLMVEILLIPGFGVVGFGGIGLMAAAILMTMVERFPTSPEFVAPRIDLYRAVLNFGVALLFTFFAGAALARFLPKSALFKRIALTAVQTHEDGYNASAVDPGLVGRRGIAVTPLRPAGIGEFDGRRVNVVARGAFLEKDSPILVAEAHGNRIVVDRDGGRAIQSTSV